MDRNALLLFLYSGRGINNTEFNKFFSVSDSSKTRFIHEVLDPSGFYVLYELEAYVDNGIVDFVDVNKIEDVSTGHGRPYSIYRELTSSEWKYSFQVFDMCFPDQSASELDSLLNLALEKQVSYAGYSINRIGKNTVGFKCPDNTTISIQKKLISYAMQYSHMNLSIIHKPSFAKEFVACFSKKPFEPIFAILSAAQPETYPNYKKLLNTYQQAELLSAIEASDLDRCVSYTDFLLNPDSDIQTIGNTVTLYGSTAVIDWFLATIPPQSCSLNSLLFDAIKNKNTDLIETIIKKGLINPSQPAWDTTSPMKAAIKTRSNVTQLLEAGFQLYSEEYLATLTLDELKDLLQYDVRLFESTIRRILAEKRYDILEIIENSNERMISKEELLLSYIASNEQERFVSGLEKGWHVNARISLFEKAYESGTQWSDLLLDYGFDINQSSGDLLRKACEYLDSDFAIYLLQNGASPYLKNSEYSQTIFELAADYHGVGKEQLKQKEILCRYLLDMNVDPIMESPHSPSICDYLFGLSRDFQLFLVDWLKAHGRINNFVCQNDITKSSDTILSIILDEFLHKYDPLVFRKMIEFGALVDVYEKTGDALFVSACAVCDINELELMIQAGANIHETDRFNRNGLYSAINHNRSKDIVEYLLSIGLDVNNYYQTKNYYNQIQVTSVLDLAQKKGDTEIIELLIQHGAKNSKR